MDRVDVNRVSCF